MMATVRNRRAVVARVKPYDTQEGRLHLVDLQYTDLDGGKAEDSGDLGARGRSAARRARRPA
ncbi:MAG: hypothetical protein M5U28_28250 [Sandaracinaceae bacterium]|nr:hypothetical protein [Sandaracinaceae bacterium]